MRFLGRMRKQCVPGPSFPPPREARASPYAGKRGTGDEASECADLILTSMIVIVDGGSVPLSRQGRSNHMEILEYPHSEAKPGSLSLFPTATILNNAHYALTSEPATPIIIIIVSRYG